MPVQPECVIYCRVSSETQTKGHGLQRQLETCIKYARARGYIVVAVFSEVWSGAEDLYSRHQAQRMARARNCKIVCEDYDRWTRQGVGDAPPANVEMASEFAHERDRAMRTLLAMPSA